MKTQKKRDVPEPVRALRVRVENWRRNKNGERQMPKELWEDAVKLAKRYGVSTVSSSVSLGYVSLKQKMHDDWGPVRKGKNAAANFVEITPAKPISAPSLVSSNEIEIHRPDGHRIVIRNADRECVRGLADAFFSK